MLYAVLRNWVSVVAEAEAEAEEESGTEGFGREVHRMMEYFYANDGLLASTRSERLQLEFHVLTDIFDRVGLRTNVGKTVSME